MTADQGQYEKFMAKLSKSKAFYARGQPKAKVFWTCSNHYRYSTESISWDELLSSAQDKIINNSVNCRTKSVK